jgi:hypothetical protein
MMDGMFLEPVRLRMKSFEERRQLMRRAVWFGGIVGALLAAAAVRAEGSCGTSVEFVDTPKEAAAEAKKQEKLVFILHVSGHFEDPRFT